MLEAHKSKKRLLGVRSRLKRAKMAPESRRGMLSGIKALVSDSHARPGELPQQLATLSYYVIIICFNKVYCTQHYVLLRHVCLMDRCLSLSQSVVLFARRFQSPDSNLVWIFTPKWWQSIKWNPGLKIMCRHNFFCELDSVSASLHNYLVIIHESLSFIVITRSPYLILCQNGW